MSLESIHLRRDELAHILREPMGQLAERCASAWGDCNALDAVLVEHFSSVAHCPYLYCVGTDGIQISNNIGQQGIVPGHLGRDSSQRPYMKEVVPA